MIITIHFRERHKSDTSKIHFKNGQISAFRVINVRCMLKVVVSVFYVTFHIQ